MDDLRDPAQIARHARELQQLNLLSAGYKSLDAGHCSPIAERNLIWRGLKVDVESRKVNRLAVLLPRK